MQFCPIGLNTQDKEIAEIALNVFYLVMVMHVPKAIQIEINHLKTIT